jgi:XisI protein
MDKLTLYRQYIIEILTNYAQKTKNTRLGDTEFDEQLLIDTQHDHYQLLTVGWEGIKRIYYPVFHIDIKNDKIWIQEDATDFDIVGILEARNVPKSDIVLGFYSPKKRGLTGYAVA